MKPRLHADGEWVDARLGLRESPGPITGTVGAAHNTVVCRRHLACISAHANAGHILRLKQSMRSMIRLLLVSSFSLPSS